MASLAIACLSCRCLLTSLGREEDSPRFFGHLEGVFLMAGMLDLWDLWLSLESPHYSRYLEMRGGLLILKNIYIVYIAARGREGIVFVG